jgi:hypothetical protein
MTLDQYLERFIEGYLFGDLQSMAAIKVPEGREYGGAGYPMVMTALTAVELLGTLTANEPFNKWNGKKRFRDFWKSYLYTGQPARQEIANLMYQFVRDGLAHTYMTKPRIEVTKAYHGQHLCRTSDESIIVDALSLTEEVRVAYQRIKTMMDDTLRATMTARFGELRAAYHVEYENQRKAITAVPLRAFTTRSPAALAPTSPGVSVTWSTRFSSTSDD